MVPIEHFITNLIHRFVCVFMVANYVKIPFLYGTFDVHYFLSFEWLPVHRPRTKARIL